MTTSIRVKRCNAKYGVVFVDNVDNKAETLRVPVEQPHLYTGAIQGQSRGNSGAIQGQSAEGIVTTVTRRSSCPDDFLRPSPITPLSLLFFSPSKSLDFSSPVLPR